MTIIALFVWFMSVVWAGTFVFAVIRTIDTGNKQWIVVAEVSGLLSVMSGLSLLMYAVDRSNP